MMASLAWIKRKKVLFSQQILAQTLTCVLSLISLNMLYSQQGFIIGPTTVCGGCHEYSLEIETTGEERYEWVVLIADDLVTNVGNTKDVIICWDEFTSNGSTPQEIRIIVSVIRDDDSFALETAISIQNPTSTSIIPIDAPLCPSSPTNPVDSISCPKVCTNTIITYALDSLSIGPGGTFREVQWDVAGAESFEVDFQQNTVRVNWGSSGIGQVSAFIFDGVCESFSSTCVQVIDRPKIELTTDPPLENNELTICRGEQVQFQNQTAFADRFEWQFGSLGASDQADPVFVFEESGTHRVSLVAYNECNCLDSTSFLVKVLESEQPSLSCLGTVCEGEAVTYTAEQTCGQYQWGISSNATILEGGGLTDDFVTVQWLSGSQGQVELLVADCSGFSACPSPTTFEIPILSDDAVINGPAFICDEALESYSLPPYSGTSFTWQTSSGGTITEGQGTNEVVVDWGAVAAGGVEELIVEYENCFLGCGGRDTLEVQLRPSFSVEGPVEICVGSTASFMATNDANGGALLANWLALNAQGDTAWQSGAATASPTLDAFAVPGNYTLYALPDDQSTTCTRIITLQFQVLDLPDPVEEIVGDTLFCSGQIHNYQVQEAGLFDYEWEVINGSSTETKQGNSINVEWGSNAPYGLQLTRISRRGSGCRSLIRSFSVSPLTLTEINGPEDVCLGEIPAYSIDLPPRYSMEWSVGPAASSSLFNQDDPSTVEVIWGRDGVGTVNLNACNQVLNKTININPLPEPAPVFPAGVCSNETATINLSTTYSSYLWLDENDNTLGTTSTINLAPGTYQVSVTDGNACSQDTAFTLIELAAPIVSISTPDFNIFCNSIPQTRLFALEGSQGYQYQWFRDGNPVGVDNPTFTATEFGRYWVEASNALGCTTRSNEIVVLEDCSGGVGGGVGGGSFPNCPAGASPDITISPTANCNERSYEALTSGMVAGTASWFFDDPDSGVNNNSTLDEPVHTYTRAGYFRVLVLADFTAGGNTGGCFAMKVDTIPVAANFAAGLACSGAEVNFTDLSTFLPGNAVQSWSWDFGDPSSGAANVSTDQNPSHTYLAGGNYTVTLSITALDGCLAIMSKNIEVRSAPVIGIADLTATCEDVAKAFAVTSSEELIRAYWDMGDPGFLGEELESESITYVYQDPGDYDINLTAIDIYGCSSELTASYTALPNNLAGQIASSVPNPICAGDSTLLSPPPGADSWKWWLGQSDIPIEEEQVWIHESQVVNVDVTTSDGCQFRPNPVLVEFQPSPQSYIRALEFDENGQLIAYHYDQFEACAGADVVIETDGNLPYTLLWSTGATSPSLSFTKESGNVLSPGTYDFSLLLTDNGTGCSQEIGPFTVVIHQNPAVFAISSDQSLPLCPGENINLSINNPDASLTYTWNTGASAATIVANDGGNYQATARNEFGCESNSNVIEVIDFAAIDLFPSGCHSRCRPDTICLPILPDVVNIQWQLDGVPLTGPDATQPNLPIEESGSYTLVMEDVNGCTLESGALNLELFDGFGDIGGEVYYDVNGNGVIDAADTMVSGVVIELLQEGILQDAVPTAEDDGYIFSGIPGDNYELVLDTTSLPLNMMANQIQQDTSIVDCDESVDIDWLLSQRCITATSNLDLVECTGNEVIYSGNTFRTDTSFVVTYQDAFGCDSLETVSIQFTEVLRSDLVVNACEGSSFSYQGVAITAGDTQEFTLATAAGCDSIVRVEVLSLSTTTEDLALSVCAGESVRYNEVDLSAGQSQTFTFLSEAGCDSIINVSVNEISVPTTNLSLSVCPGSTVEYGGQSLQGGVQEQFVFTSIAGCDSLVNVIVAEVIPESIALTVQACPGENVFYNGEEIAPGQVREFTFLSVAGCDSMVTVTAASFPSLDFTLETTASCADASTGTVRAIDIIGPAQAIEYRVDDQAFSMDLIWAAQSIGVHTYTIRDQNGCTYEKDFVIPSTPSIELGEATAFFPCAASSLEISPVILSEEQVDLEYQWEDGSTLPNLLIDSPGTYAVSISNACESLVQQVIVEPEFDGSDQAFYVPNAFSPNEDGLNEELKAFVAPDVILQSFDLHIFDRWGNQLFATDQIEQGWNGRLNGTMLDPAVFVWWVEATYERCGQTYTVQEKGDVVLMW
ncbi:MAG: PKD domain-containing protein [Saprospiraceae bacterium]|nr:PKD domain-containing protein [Saprospiraceae bacterium]